jgi:hypothetical protein
MNETEYSVNKRTENLTAYNIYLYAETFLQMTFRGTHRGICMHAKGNYLDQVHSDKMFLEIVRQLG